MTSTALHDEETRARLLIAVRERGFTPKVRDIPLLATLYADADDVLTSLIDIAIERSAERAVAPLVREFAGFAPRVRARVTRVLSKTGTADVRAFLLAALTDPDAKTRRNAIIGLGRQEGADIENALLALLSSAPPIEQKRSIAATLGKIGGAASRSALESLRDDDPELRRIVERALLMLGRTALRTTKSRVDLSRRGSSPVPVLLQCRRGLEAILEEELGPRFEPRIERPGVVRAVAHGPLLELLIARTAVAFSLPFRARPIEGDLDVAVADAIAAPEVRAALNHWTIGPVRYRLSFASGGHQRSLVWSVAKKVPERAPELINDPTDSTWEITVVESARGIALEVAPRAFEDPRFAYRKGDIPAASHPTIAAALARVSGVTGRDVVWDPFVGSGTELIECGLLAPEARLFGRDIDPDALETAARNLDAAGLSASLAQSDALRAGPPGVTLIVTNPPFGRRVAREASLGPMLDAFVGHAARTLLPGGRLVWLAPFAERARGAADRARLMLERAADVDMGGFTAELQVWRR